MCVSLFVPFDSSRKTYDMNKAFIKITKIKTQICQKIPWLYYLILLKL